jgi:transketolase
MPLGEAVAAADELAEEGISVRVVDMFFVKPLDEALVLKCAEETGRIVTAEEHSVIGGLGGAVAEVLCASGRTGVRQEFVGLCDTHAESGPYDALKRKYGLDKAAIIEKIKKAI